VSFVFHISIPELFSFNQAIILKQRLTIVYLYGNSNKHNKNIDLVFFSSLFYKTFANKNDQFLYSLLVDITIENNKNHILLD